MSATELFNSCLAGCENNKILAAQQFLIRVKKEYPDIKMSECAKICGYGDEKARQNFRNSVVIPVRNAIGIKKLGLTTDTVKRLYSNKVELSETEISLRDTINKYLPIRDRNVIPKDKFSHLEGLLDD